MSVRPCRLSSPNQLRVAAVAAVAAQLAGEHLRAGADAAGGAVHLAVVGAHLSGTPLNGQLLERGATLLQAGGLVAPAAGLSRVGMEYRCQLSM